MYVFYALLACILSQMTKKKKKVVKEVYVKP